MKLLTLFSRPILIEYRARLISEATVYTVLSTLVAYIVPLVMVWRSDGFWLRESTFREMPNVEFCRKFIVLLNSVDDQLSQPKVSNLMVVDKLFGYSTFSVVNEGFRRAGQFLPIQTKDYEVDADLDDRLDELNLQFDIPVDLRQDRIFGVQLILLFNYQLQSKIDLRMQTLATFQYHTARPGQRIRIEGDLELVQRVPFFHRGFDFSYNYSMIPEDSGDQEEAETFIIEEMLQQYTRRNYYTRLVPTLVHWQPLYPLANDETASFHIDLNLRYQNQVFRYETGFWYLLKWGLVQYLTVWIVLQYFIQKLNHYIFRNCLVPSWQHLPDSGLLRKSSSMATNNNKFWKQH